LLLGDWESTKDTLHLRSQIVGKTRLALMPMRNHWWNVALYPSARGLTTQRMPVEAGNLEIELDLVDHRLRARTRKSETEFGCMTDYPLPTSTAVLPTPSPASARRSTSGRLLSAYR
jgi:Family of unknown function (DUF5996)